MEKNGWKLSVRPQGLCLGKISLILRVCVEIQACSVDFRMIQHMKIMIHYRHPTKRID